MEAQRQQHYDPESNREAERTVSLFRRCVFLLLVAAGVIALVFSLDETRPIRFSSPAVHVTSLSLSLSSTALPPAISGNWSVTLSVKNPRWRHRFSWDHTQVMLFYGDEFVAGTFLERFSVAPRGKATVETRAVAFSLEVGDQAARAMGMDREDSGVMELAVILLHHDEGRRYWLNWHSSYCHGLKVGFSSHNQSRVGLILSGSPHKCT